MTDNDDKPQSEPLAITVGKETVYHTTRLPRGFRIRTSAGTQIEFVLAPNSQFKFNPASDDVASLETFLVDRPDKLKPV